MKKKTKKQNKQQLMKQAKKRDWDQLAYDIILMEEALRAGLNPKYLILLNIKLQIWEKEKASRIFQTFNMKSFLNKGFDDSDIEYS
jgi:hypothetical protein